jgi:integral membrane sensor domain MASE1
VTRDAEDVALDARDRRPIAVALLIVAAILVYRSTHWDMVQTWVRSDTFGHCFLIPVIAAFLVWVKRKELRAAQWTTSYGVARARGARLWLVRRAGGARGRRTSRSSR